MLEREQVVAPKFVERFQQGQVKEGETVVLQCRAVGTPTPVLSWQKDGVGIKSCPAMQVIVISLLWLNGSFNLNFCCTSL